MQITIIIMQVGLERPDMNAGSICWKLRSIKSPQTENVDRGPGPGQRANLQALRLPGPCREPAGLRLPNHDDCQKEEQNSLLRRSTKHGNLVILSELMPHCTALRVLTDQLRYRTL